MANSLAAPGVDASPDVQSEPKAADSPLIANRPESIESALNDVPQKGIVLSPDPDALPVTYVFRTHGHPALEPRLGVLQILALDRTAKVVRLRYRLEE